MSNPNVPVPELHENFLRDLKELLERYEAEMEIRDDGKCYGLQSGVAEVSFCGYYGGSKGVPDRDYSYFELPKYLP